MKTVIYFDGVCNLCNGFVDFLIRRDKKGIIRFSSLQSKAAIEYFKGGIPEETVVLVHDGKDFYRSTAILRAAGLLAFPWKISAVFLIVPVVLRDGVYAFVAQNRYKWFGKKETCRVPTFAERDRFLE